MKLEKITNDRSGRSHPAEKRWYDDACGAALALELVGERWALLIVRELMFGARRFGEIRRNLPGISANVLTQRLEGLEASGIVVRRQLPSPANVQVYDLTEWGHEMDATILEMGKWAARSPRHDPFAYLSTASAMMSLQAMMNPVLARGIAMRVAFRFPDDAFVVELRDGAITATRTAQGNDADVTFTGDTMAFRRTLYGKEGMGGAGLLSPYGDRAAAERFVGLFALPVKAPAPEVASAG